VVVTLSSPHSKLIFTPRLIRFINACVVEADSEALRRWGRHIVGRSTPAAAIRLYESLYDVDLRPQLTSISLPTLIIHGERDAIVPVRAAEELAAHLSNHQLLILPGAGHVPTMTQPQVVTSAINAFFTRDQVA
jgi:pimeloyl-ACP methyl ester carboxylesterase